MEHFTLPDHFTDADVQKVKDTALRKMAIAFNTHKKTVWDNYVDGERKTPEFKGTLEKQREHWPAFVKFKESELSKERSRKNKANAAKKMQFHRLGPGGYAVAMPKWDKSEQEMVDAGVTPVTRSCPPGPELVSMRMGGVGPEGRPGFEEGKSKMSGREVTSSNRRCFNGGVHTQ